MFCWWWCCCLFIYLILFIYSSAKCVLLKKRYKNYLSQASTGHRTGSHLGFRTYNHMEKRTIMEECCNVRTKIFSHHFIAWQLFLCMMVLASAYCALLGQGRRRHDLGFAHMNVTYRCAVFVLWSNNYILSTLQGNNDSKIGESASWHHRNLWINRAQRVRYKIKCILLYRFFFFYQVWK